MLTHLSTALHALDRRRHPDFLPDTLGRWDQDKQYYFKKTCGKHHAFMLLRSVQRNHGKALRCKYCEGKGSSHEQKLLASIHGLQSEMGFVPYTVTEAKFLRGSYGGADLYFPDFNLAVQVDGEHHFREEARDDTKEGSSLRDQSQRDEEWNKACILAGVNMWRVHYLDAGCPCSVLKAMLLRARAHEGKPFIELSQGFRKL